MATTHSVFWTRRACFVALLTFIAISVVVIEWKSYQHARVRSRLRSLGVSVSRSSLTATIEKALSHEQANEVRMLIDLNGSIDVLLFVDAQIGDHDLAEICKTAQAKFVSLQGLHYDDATIRSLLQCANVTACDLSGTGITDSCVDDVIQAFRISSIGIADTAISPEARARIRAARPDLTIEP